jgi:hypothetical protein
MQELKSSGSESGPPKRSLIPLVGIAGATIVLVLVGTLMAVPFLIRREPPAGFVYQVGNWRAAADLEVAPDGSYQLDVAFSELNGAAVDPGSVSLALTMEGHEAMSTLVPVSRIGLGSYRAAGLLPSEGKWSFNVAADGNAFEIIVNRAASF